MRREADSRAAPRSQPRQLPHQAPVPTAEQRPATAAPLQANGEAGKTGEGGGALAELKQVSMLAIPTVFDLVATVLMNVGLLSVTASVYQMMRGAEMLFAALFTVTFLHRR